VPEQQPVAQISLAETGSNTYNQLGNSWTERAESSLPVRPIKISIGRLLLHLFHLHYVVVSVAKWREILMGMAIAKDLLGRFESCKCVIKYLSKSLEALYLGAVEMSI
jgi:hypothetical protein